MFDSTPTAPLCALGGASIEQWTTVFRSLHELLHCITSFTYSWFHPDIAILSLFLALWLSLSLSFQGLTKHSIHLGNTDALLQTSKLGFHMSILIKLKRDFNHLKKQKESTSSSCWQKKSFVQTLGWFFFSAAFCSTALLFVSLGCTLIKGWQESLSSNLKWFVKILIRGFSLLPSRHLGHRSHTTLLEQSDCFYRAAFRQIK